MSYSGSYILCKVKGKIIPVQAAEAFRFARGWGSHIFRHSPHRCRQDCQPYAPAALYPPGRFLVLISVRGWVDPRAIVRLEGLGKLKMSTSSGTRTGDLPACSTVPQPTTLPRAPIFYVTNETLADGYCLYLYMLVFCTCKKLQKNF
jgi:hypothetical protein